MNRVWWVLRTSVSESVLGGATIVCTLLAPPEYASRDSPAPSMEISDILNLGVTGATLDEATRHAANSTSIGGVRIR